jgi:hypothetical protein
MPRVYVRLDDVAFRLRLLRHGASHVWVGDQESAMIRPQGPRVEVRAAAHRQRGLFAAGRSRDARSQWLPIGGRTEWCRTAARVDCRCTLKLSKATRMLAAKPVSPLANPSGRPPGRGWSSDVTPTPRPPAVISDAESAEQPSQIRRSPMAPKAEDAWDVGPECWGCQRCSRRWQLFFSVKEPGSVAGDDRTARFPGSSRAAVAFGLEMTRRAGAS